ncbi:MAG: radical SAM protein [Candidatus Eisenbacteria bacterium]|uniref:Radical SAM protein n=1 Tax=Eiseniibacteriota bacterium TaxID=2212470 RepID=A0A948W587_UNCEI|nr:radical SAM protein [Candidatus Eisenbacteria bacterium]MBU1949644.1 radical SAM protein [Candidatus Eisenbacteria bacterium]MBU2693037.1 radical SAM protein [Candidatus Eisenbacteria bacterium]
MEYTGSVYRPPSEARSLIIQVTLGCSWNKCTFCRMYREKNFRVTPEAEVFAFIDEARCQLGPGVRRVFLADGDALCLKTEKLLRILKKLQVTFPDLHRVGIYTYEHNFRGKSDEELRQLVENKLTLGYLGLESGDEEVLERINKGCTAVQMVEAVRRMQAAGMKTSVMTLLGLGGARLSYRHAKRSAEILNQMNPRFTSFLTVTLIDKTELYDQAGAGEFDQLTPMESLQELRWIVEDLELDGSILRANHASNYLPLGGTLPRNKAEILAAIDAALRGDVSLRPEFLRGL